jgi:hypothetical protein
MMVSAPCHGADPPDEGLAGAGPGDTANRRATSDVANQGRPGPLPTVRGRAADPPFWWRWGGEPAADVRPPSTVGHEPSGGPGLMP